MHNFDAIFAATNAPRRSAYNRIERKMVPLSRELSGLILPLDHYGSHLDAAGKTINTDQEQQNFGFAGQVPSDIWSEVEIHGFPTVTENIDPAKSELNLHI